MYVGSGRFIVEEGQPIIVEYKISEVAAPCHLQLGNEVPRALESR